MTVPGWPHARGLAASGLGGRLRARIHSGGAMQGTQIDADEFRAGQQQSWDTASKGWRDWHELIDRSTTIVSERIVSMAGVEPGHRVLDVAAGYGEPLLTHAHGVRAQRQGGHP